MHYYNWMDFSKEKLKKDFIMPFWKKWIKYKIVTIKKIKNQKINGYLAYSFLKTP